MIFIIVRIKSVFDHDYVSQSEWDVKNLNPSSYHMSRPIRRTVIFSLEILEKN